MDGAEPNQSSFNLQEHLALERTALAYVRTGLSMMAIGFVVARFGLVLRIMQVNSQPTPHAAPGRSLWLGTALVLIGSAVTGLSAWQYWKQIEQLNQSVQQGRGASWLAVTLALVLTVFGVAMSAYLVNSSMG
jgi:putative membrane protein